MTNPIEPGPSQLGGTVGGRLARLVSDAVVTSKAKMAGHTTNVGNKIFTDVTNHVSDEVRAMMGPLWRKLASDPNMDPELKHLFHSLGNQRGQAMAWIGGAATSALMAGGLMEVLANMMRPVTLPIIRHNPTAPLDAGTAARMVPRGFMGADQAAEDAASNGVNRTRFNAMVEAAYVWPTIDELRAMLNRGEASLQDATNVLKKLGIPPQWAVRLLDLRKTPLSPETLAAMWNRSIVGTDEGAAIAADSGVSKQDFVRLTELYGEPLPLGDLQEAYRRGFIDQAQFARGWAQGPIRNEWRPVAERLQYRRMLPEAAADAVNQGHMDLDVGKRIAHEHGLDPGDFETIIQTAGQPPGIELMEEARNRGIISEEMWERTFKESRIKNIYIDVLRKMRTRLIPMETARLMYREGAYTEDELIRTAKGHGFSDRDAQAQADLEVLRRSEGTKELSRAQLMDLYEEDLIDRSTLERGLTELGYATGIVGWQVELAEMNKVRTFVRAATNRVKASYVANRIDSSEAASLLDEIGLPPLQRDRLMSIWDIERDIVSAQLTTAQIMSALKKGFIDEQGAFTRLLGRGYSPEDAGILMRLGGVEPPSE